MCFDLLDFLIKVYAKGVRGEFDKEKRVYQRSKGIAKGQKMCYNLY